MYTKADFTAAIASTIDNYPAIAALYRAGDPRILQNLGYPLKAGQFKGNSQ